MESNTASVPRVIDVDDLSASGESDKETSFAINPLADDLLRRCIKVFDEIAILEKKLLQRLPPKQRSKKGNLPIELRHFKNAIQVEQRLLENLSYAAPSPKTTHSLRSSNLKFLESVWSVAKTCSGLQVIFRTVHLLDFPPDDVPKLKGKEKKQLKRKKTPVQVDIIAQSGLEWIKVANISRKRLETEWAKARWEAEGFQDDLSEDEEEDNDQDRSSDFCHSDDDEDLSASKSSLNKTSKEELAKTILAFQHDSDAFSLVKSARSMVAAAQQTRVQYLHPEITIVLPNIIYTQEEEERSDPDSPVHSLISAILSTGARVQAGDNKIICPVSPPDGTASPKDSYGNKIITHRSQTPQNINNPDNDISDTKKIEDVLHNLSASSDPVSLITPSILLDCTILLALVSDLSHEDVVETPVFHRYILQQVRSEREEPLLPHWVYPSVQGRKMVCTFEAYKRFREIVDIVGSEREKQRAEVLVYGGERDWRHPSKNRPSSSTSASVKELLEEDVLPPGKTRKELLETLRGLSRHDVPETLLLPITVVESLESQIMANNPVAAKIGPELSAVNRSSLFTAWEMGITIVTTNGSVVKRLEWLVEENRVRDDDVGPKVHLLAIARSLVGKMKKVATEIAED